MGRYRTYAAKTQVEECRRLEIGSLARYSRLQPGLGGSIHWTRGGRDDGQIGYQVLTDGVYLSYTVTPYQGTPAPYGYVVPLAWSHLVSGGRRPWWQCPACGRRCGVLYLPPGAGRFACRRCYDLAYASQQDRMRRWDRDPGGYLATTAWGRALLAELQPPPRPRPAPAPPGKRPRGRPRTKRKYTRRAPLPGVS